MESRELKANKVKLILIAPASPNHLVPYLSATWPQITPKAAEAKDAIV